MSQRKRPTGSDDARRKTGSNEVLDRLFVYGTLRQGQTARSLIANQITRCVSATAAGAIYVFPMGYVGFVDHGDIPGNADAGHVIGELLWLTDLPATLGLLDAYEGDDYARVLKQVELTTGELVWSWIYALADPASIKHGRLLEHGDWVRYWSEQR